MKKNAFIFAIVFWCLAVQAWAGCPTNELIQNTQTPIIFSYEKRDGTGEDTTNTANKKVSFAYYNGSAWRWYNGTDWTATTESQLAMTQLTGGQYYYLLSAAALSATVLDKYIVIRFDEIDDVDVTMSCLSYVQPEKRLTINKVWDEPKTNHTTAGTFGYYLDAQVSAAGGGGAADWTATEKNQLRYRLGIDGTTATPTATPSLGDVGITQTGADKVWASSTRALTDKAGFSLSAAGIDAIWDEARTGHTTAGTFGYYLDAPVSTAGGGGAADWTTDEKNQLRYRLGIDGTEAAPATNTPSLGTLTANVADKTGFSLAADQSAVTIGTVGTVTNPVTAGTVNDKTGYSLSTAGVDAILNDTIEGSYTLRQVLCAAAAAIYGKTSGGGTTTIVFRNLGDTVNRITETVAAGGNRSAVTLNLTGCQ